MPVFKNTIKLKHSSLYFFRYSNPVTRNLKTWDLNPLVIILAMTPKTILCCNIHWVPKYLRKKFINLVMELAEKVVQKGKIKLLPRVVYDQIKNGPFRFALPGIRRYYLSRITNIQEIPPEFWKEIKVSDERYKKRSATAKTTKGYFK